LGLPGLTAGGADRCRDKHASRSALTAAGLRQPRFALVDTAEAAAGVADSVGYPVIVKPRGMAASIGVTRADSRAELLAAFAVAQRLSHSGPPAYEGGVLIEELVVGPEVSIDGAVSRGEYLPFCVARKQVGFAPHFEETGHIVEGADPLLTDPELLRVLAQAHRALGLRDGITHTEVRFSPAGPVIIEVNGRLGGDLIPYLGQLATGVDPGGIAADVAVGRAPRTEPMRRDTIGVRFLYPPMDCRVRDVTVPAPGAVPGLVEAKPLVAPGAELRLPPRANLGRYGYVICAADRPAACQARLDDAAKLADVQAEPLESAHADHRPW
ncbi:MAG: ATP-grasp domain-containing protein, partial [Natronosporangium sp.]